MSIWLNALAGGIEGLGVSISAGAQEKRAARGLALRESYLTTRQNTAIAAQTTAREDTQEFSDEQRELVRKATAEQNRLTLKQRTDQAGEDRKFRKELAEFTSGKVMEQINARIKAAESEGDKDRKAAAARLKEQLRAAGAQAAQRNQLAAFESFVDQVERRAAEYPAQDADGNLIYNDEGDTVPDFDLEIEMIQLAIAGGNVPTWEQPPRTAQQLMTYAEELGSVDAAVAATKRVGYVVPLRAIEEARRLSVQPRISAPPRISQPQPSGGNRSDWR